MTLFEEIVIFGCGGVGSWLAEYIARSKMANVISIVDFDIVEEKNLTRQNYKKSDERTPKVSAMQDRILNIDPEVEVLLYNRRVTSDEDASTFDRSIPAIICTDNVVSKRIIAKHFEHFCIVNCDKDFVEIKTFLDESEQKAWDMGGGYTSEQDIVSNIYAAVGVFSLMKCYGLNFFIRPRKYKFAPERSLRMAGDTNGENES